MSALTTELPRWIPWTVLAASFLGSPHCVAMCGGLVAGVGTDRSRVAQYHLGRLAGYLSLGALAGSLGAAVFSAPAFQALPWIAALLLGASFILLGWRAWRGQSLHVFRLPQPMLNWLYGRARGRAGLVGALSAFLPCGWLHGFVLGAVATQSPVRGAVFLLFFWLGTLPALGAASWAVGGALNASFRRAPRWAAALLIVAGIATVSFKMSELFTGTEESGSCPLHEHHSAHSAATPPDAPADPHLGMRMHESRKNSGP